MSSVLRFAKQHRLLMSFVLFGGFFFTFGVSSNSSVFADCGAQTSIHGYAGAIIDVRAKPYKQPTREVGNAVRVTTLSPTYSGGNVVHLGNGPEGVDNRQSAVTFNQIGNGCVPGFGGSSVVLGYGVTSNGGNWALDCDFSRRPASEGFQEFSVTGVGTPAGLRTPTAAQIADGFGWTTKTIRPGNGTTSYTAVIFNEPPPNPPPTTYEWDYNLQGNSDCTSMRGFSRLIWIRPDGVRQNIVPQFRIIWLSPSGPVGVSDWQNTGINGATDRNNPDSLRFQVNFGAAMGAMIWGSTGGFRDFSLQMRYTPAGQSTTDTFSVYAKNCSNQPLDFGVTGSCSRIIVNNMNDPDRSNVAYAWEVFERGPNGEYSAPAVQSGGGNGLGTFPIDITPPEQNRVNNGYVLRVSAVDLYGSGDSVPGGGLVYRDFPVGPCYVATCTTSIVSNVPGGAVGNAVQAGQQFTLNYSINETGEWRVPDGSISLTSQPVADWPGLEGPLPKEHIGRNGPITLTAPDTVSSFTINFYPDWWGLFPVGVPSSYVCPITIDVYKPYKITPTASDVSLSDTENPDRVTFSSRTEKLIPANVTVPGVRAERKITRNGTQIGPTFNDPSPYYRAGDPGNVRPFVDSTNIPQPNTGGDAFCGFITVFPAEGWIGPRDQRTVTVPSAADATLGCDPPTWQCDAGGCDTPPPPCAQPGTKCGSVRIVNKPYVKVYGGDVAAGGGFVSNSGVCSASTAPKGIFAYMRPLEENVPFSSVNPIKTGKSGSGSQLAAFAWGNSGVVSGFATAVLRNSPPLATQGNGLTFGSAGATPSMSADNPVLGGKLAGDAICLPNYYNDTQYPDGNPNRINGGGATQVDTALLVGNNNKQTVFSSDNSRITLVSSGNYRARHTVYVNGEVRISGNIIYDGSGYGGTDLNTIPNFTLVVLGNIYVDKNVTRLDGTYIAQPKDGEPNTGKIFTCSDSNGFRGISSASEIFSTCGTDGTGSSVDRLRVNGTFIADQVILNRTKNTLRDSKFQEQSGASNAAEIFTFSPDVYLSPPVFRPNSTITSGDYQYIATLPPIL